MFGYNVVLLTYFSAKHREKDWKSRENGWKDNSARIVEDMQSFKRQV